MAQAPPQFTISVEYVEVEARVLDDDGLPLFEFLLRFRLSLQQRQTRWETMYRSITRIALQVLPDSYVLTIEAERPDSKAEAVRRSSPFRVVAN